MLVRTLYRILHKNIFANNNQYYSPQDVFSNISESLEQYKRTMITNASLQFKQVFRLSIIHSIFLASVNINGTSR